jgi:hypothetical protein
MRYLEKCHPAISRQAAGIQKMSGRRRYAVYSIRADLKNRMGGISDLDNLVSTPWTQKSFISKRRLDSQAGRHHRPVQLVHLANGQGLD